MSNITPVFTLDNGLSLTTAVGVSTVLSLLYVLTIYARNVGSTKEIVNGTEEIDRNDPQEVKARIIKVSAFTALVVAVLPACLAKLSEEPLNKIYAEFGILAGFRYRYHELHFEVGHALLFFRDIAQTMLLLVLLFIGPLIDLLVFSSSTPMRVVNDLTVQLRTIQGIRDLIVGPLTEEIVYTAGIIVTLFQVPGVSKMTLIFLPPALFSFAHFHHAYEMYTKKYNMNIILATTAFQLLYTFLFGIFTNFLFLRQDNLWSCFFAHSFCNFMGVPKFKVDTTKFQYWNYVYYALLVVGAFAFHSFLFSFSQSSLALVQWNDKV